MQFLQVDNVFSSKASQICRLSVGCLLKSHEHAEQRILSDLAIVTVQAHPTYIPMVQCVMATGYIPMVHCFTPCEARLRPAACAGPVTHIGGAHVISNILRLYRGQVL